MPKQRFAGTLESARGGGAFVALPDEVIEGLGGGSRFRVTGTLNGTEFTSSAMAMGGGRICLGVHKATRQTAGAEIGDTVEVELELDTRPREVQVPAELAAALAADPGAGATFEKLPFTRRREHAEAIAGAKREETRRRRLAKIMAELRGEE